MRLKYFTAKATPMLTDTDLQQLRLFLANSDNYSNLYGCMTLPSCKGVLIINNKGSKPIDYFLNEDRANGPNINGIPFTGYTDLILTKKHRTTQQTETICLPKK